ncbi:hypothetical protein ACFLUJ_00750 [Chloroflexota bacterium]
MITFAFMTPIVFTPYGDIDDTPLEEQTSNRSSFSFTNITQPRSTVLFIGYQAFGTLGRQIPDDAKRVRTMGQHYLMRLRTAQIYSGPAHTERYEFLKWIPDFYSTPKREFFVHGKPRTTKHFSQFLREKPDEEYQH